MSDLISFRVPGIPETKGSWRSVGKGRMIPDNPKSAPWQETISWAARNAMHRVTRSSHMFATVDRVGVSLVFVLPVPPTKAKKYRRDADKLARNALDAMTGIVYIDDEQVDELDVSKLTSTRSTEWGVSIRVYRLTDQP